MNHFIILFLAFSFFGNLSLADDKYPYPELVVVPSASDRLQREADDEEKMMFKTHLAMQASAAMTLLAGMALSSDKDPEGKASEEDDKAAKDAGMIGTMIGGGWLATTTLMSLAYTPYQTGWREIKKMKPKSDREKLERERLAEEYLERPAIIGNSLEWLSMFSNLAAGGFMAASARQGENKVLGALAGIAAFAPFIFNYHWEDTFNKHEDYKKRIYGPITENGVIYNPYNAKLYPALMVSLAF